VNYDQPVNAHAMLTSSQHNLTSVNPFVRSKSACDMFRAVKVMFYISMLWRIDELCVFMMLMISRGITCLTEDDVLI